ncbi:MAG: winged helix-turn-helix transcriptional regulator [Thermoplasmata archaeon]|nr:winged helix-turn-helix transcriptional regulator [Thermoplasmata archaeon]
MSELSEKEILAAYILLHCPHLTLKEASSIIGVSPATLSLYKKRLINLGVIYRVRTPTIRSSGIEFLLMVSGKIQKGLKPETVYEEMVRLLDKKGKIIFFMSDSYDFVSYIGFSTSDEFVEGLGVFKNPENGWQMDVRFASELSSVEIRNFLDLSQPLKWSMPEVSFPALEGCWRRLTPLPSPPSTKRARDVLRALTEDPASTCEEVAERIGISRQAVGQIKRRLRKKGQLYEGYVMNPRRLSMNVLSFYFIYPSSHLSKRSFLKAADAMEKVFFPPFFMVSSGTMHFIWPHKDLAAMKDFSARVVDVLSSSGAEDARLENVVLDMRFGGTYTKISLAGMGGGGSC